MNPRVFSEILEVIKAEEQRRVSLLQGDHPDAGYHQWTFQDEPLLNELCLMLLVTLRHHVERRLAEFAARSVDGGKTISHDDYEARLTQLRKVNKQGKSIGWKWQEIEKRLGITSKDSRKERCLETLRLLANSYKHDPFVEPSDELREFLQLPDVNFASLPESGLVRQELGKLVGLSGAASYPEIVDYYLTIVNAYLSELESHTSLSEVQWSLASLDPAKFLH